MKLPILLIMVSIFLKYEMLYILIQFFLSDIPLEENKIFIEIETLTGKVKTTKEIDREDWNSSYFMVNNIFHTILLLKKVSIIILVIISLIFLWN